MPGSYYKNKNWSCYYSEATTFSLHPVKHITTGEGGVVTTNNQKIYEKLIFSEIMECIRFLQI